jgi:hypothetical protein
MERVMADDNVIRIFGESPEQVAYRLMHDIAKCEGKKLNANGNHNVSREWLLTTFAQCLLTVRRPGAVSEHLNVDIQDREID